MPQRNGTQTAVIPPLGAAYIAMVKAGVVRDLPGVRRMKDGIVRGRMEETLEPLSRALDFVLTGDERHILEANQIVADVTRDVLAKLYEAGVPPPSTT